MTIRGFCAYDESSPHKGAELSAPGRAAWTGSLLPSRIDEMAGDGVTPLRRDRRARRLSSSAACASVVLPVILIVVINLLLVHRRAATQKVCGHIPQ